MARPLGYAFYIYRFFGPDRTWKKTPIFKFYIYFYPVRRSVIVLPKIISSRTPAVNDCAASLRSLPISMWDVPTSSFCDLRNNP